MRSFSRRLRVERLECRCLLASLGEQETMAVAIPEPIQESASIELSEVQGLRGAAVEISFDQQRLQIDPRDVRAGTAWGGKGMSVVNVDNAEGMINIFLFSARELELGQGSLVEIDFRRNDIDKTGHQPQIDIQRLRINDNEIAVGDADLKNFGSPILDTQPRLSLQFKTAPEGESNHLLTTETSESTKTSESTEALGAEPDEPVIPFPTPLGSPDVVQPIPPGGEITSESHHVCWPNPGWQATWENDFVPSAHEASVIKGPQRPPEEHDGDLPGQPGPPATGPTHLESPGYDNDVFPSEKRERAVDSQPAFPNSAPLPLPLRETDATANVQRQWKRKWFHWFSADLDQAEGLSAD